MGPNLILPPVDLRWDCNHSERWEQIALTRHKDVNISWARSEKVFLPVGKRYIIYGYFHFCEGEEMEEIVYNNIADATDSLAIKGHKSDLLKMLSYCKL